MADSPQLQPFSYQREDGADTSAASLALLSQMTLLLLLLLLGYKIFTPTAIALAVCCPPGQSLFPMPIRGLLLLAEISSRFREGCVRLAPELTPGPGCCLFVCFFPIFGRKSYE